MFSFKLGFTKFLEKKWKMPVTCYIPRGKFLPLLLAELSTSGRSVMSLAESLHLLTCLYSWRLWLFWPCCTSLLRQKVTMSSKNLFSVHFQGLKPSRAMFSVPQHMWSARSVTSHLLHSLTVCFPSRIKVLKAWAMNSFTKKNPSRNLTASWQFPKYRYICTLKSCFVIQCYVTSWISAISSSTKLFISSKP